MEESMSEQSLQKPSVCPMDCPDTCSLTVTVEDEKVVKVRGSRVNPITEGVLCNKVSRYYPEFVHGDTRLTTPMKRTGAKGEGRFEEISWDEAIDLVHAGLTRVIDAHGPQAVLPFNYSGPHGLISCDSMSLRFFHKMGASLLSRRPLCGGIKSEAYAATYGLVPGMPPEQIDLAETIIVWGNNVTVSNLHLQRRLNAARKKGSKVVVIDPKRIKTAEQADLFLPINPGTDVVLAWALANELERTGGFDHAFIEKHVHGFEEFMALAREYPVERAAEICGLPAEDIRTVAKWYREATPAAINYGNGLERNRNGGSAIRAICALPALAGKFGVPGGGLQAAAGNAFPKTMARLQRPDLIPEGTRTLNILDVSKHVLDESLDPPVKALFIYNHNPVIVHPDQNRMKRALLTEDLFVVGAEVAMTDSMDYCDVVLPASTHFEHEDLYAAYGQQYLQRAEAVIPPYGQSLPNTEIFRRLAARFGYDDPIFKASDKELMSEAIDEGDIRLKGVNPIEIPTDTAIRMEFDGEEPVMFKNVFPATPSGKVELLSEDLERQYGAALPRYAELQDDYPLTLITPSSDKRISSTFGGVKACDETPKLDMHPDDAAARGLDDGAMVKVWNDLGEVHLPLRVTDAIRPGVLCSAKGAWFKTTDNDQTVSALAPLDKADIAEGACYNDCRVEVAAYAG
jgi:anaerobic selenocysteine-containing dehydrogenase